MTAITAGAVMALREKTGLPMMECKKALTESNGDEEKAILWLRENGKVKQLNRTDRTTEFGRVGIYTDGEKGAMVEFKCESAPVTQLEEFISLADDLAKVLAENPSITTAEELLAQPSNVKAGSTLGDLKDDMFNRIREVFNVGRMIRVEGSTGGYSHNSSTVSGVLVEVEGDNAAAVRDVAMHVAAMSPSVLSKDDIDPALVEKERAILKAAAMNEDSSKPENIIDKMVEGRLRNYYAQVALLEQPFVKEPKQTVAQYAKDNGVTIKNFTHWVIGDDAPAAEEGAEG
ncbi:translation elongation factor Ts [Bremerella sp. JC817]|uniref:translation elongation factor Ts n=1 Tax=Bremerella sp. JC817 TaxID=3231756 RepID=UPI00345897D7